MCEETGYEGMEQQRLIKVPSHISYICRDLKITAGPGLSVLLPIFRMVTVSFGFMGSAFPWTTYWSYFKAPLNPVKGVSCVLVILSQASCGCETSV